MFYGKNEENHSDNSKNTENDDDLILQILPYEYVF